MIMTKMILTYDLCYRNHQKYEVLGNIYENPELLKTE